MSLIYPLKNPYRISSPYGYRTHPITHKPQFHNGIDYACPIGSRVMAACDGIIVKAWEDDLNGKAIRLMDSEGGLRVSYAHLSEVFVEQWQVVKQGDVIAYSGSTGRSSGPHLHFGIYVSLGWKASNPEKFI